MYYSIKIELDENQLDLDEMDLIQMKSSFLTQIDEILSHIPSNCQKCLFRCDDIDIVYIALYLLFSSSLLYLYIYFMILVRL